jgi:hypothetical protein
MFFSSFLFLIVSIVAYYINDQKYSMLFLILFITSLIVHTKNTILTNLIDKIAIGSIVIYGGKLFFEKLYSLLYSNYYTEDYIFISKIYLSSFVVTTFLFTIYIYVYGYCINDFCFYHDRIIANKYHLLLHMIGCLGHIGIMVL